MYVNKKIGGFGICVYSMVDYGLGMVDIYIYLYDVSCKYRSLFLISALKKPLKWSCI